MAVAARAYTGGVIQPAVSGRVIGGVVGGLIGGAVFGMMMGMQPMIASLVRSESAAVGLIVHMVISAIIGAGFGLVFWESGDDPSAWRDLGRPLRRYLVDPGAAGHHADDDMGMGPQFGMALTIPMMMSLLGHVIFGVVAGLTYPVVVSRLR